MVSRRQLQGFRIANRKPDTSLTPPHVYLGSAYQTLKAFANFSPGFALKPWVQKGPKEIFATLKGLRRVL